MFGIAKQYDGNMIFLCDLFDYPRYDTEADTAEIVSEHLTKECMKARNAKLIEYADKCFCYYNPGRSRSGTGQTVRKGIGIVNFYDNIL